MTVDENHWTINDVCDTCGRKWAIGEWVFRQYVNGDYKLICSRCAVDEWGGVVCIGEYTANI